MKLLSRKLREKGFSLIELMVVVAIIGVLAAIAIPNFRTYRAKARTSEAKIHLSTIWTAEEAFRNEYDAYATCFDTMGVAQVQNNYYAYGFEDADRSSGGVSGCDHTTNKRTANKSSSGTNASIDDLDDTTNSAVAVDTKASRTEFVAGAIGYINAAGSAAKEDLDKWQIDEAKDLKNANPAL